MKPTIKYQAEDDAAYIRLSNDRILESEEVAPNIVFDYDAEGRIVGIEILTATKLLAPGDWQNPRLPGKARFNAAE
ncbi:MAG: DUF2283 domain-containing protein [Rhodopseudomonas palustris]|uniref:DUF2283 domain-containing protein n=1 Tax=Rhodopseudomonas palustris TaxID=1076 RepID=A0A933RZC3_RHOPL|nr:DUF2283 domain-containing protein [Rhodopseudomonas palustris]